MISSMWMGEEMKQMFDYLSGYYCSVVLEHDDKV